MDIAELLHISVKHNASDLHLSSGVVPLLRVNGEMKSLNLPILDAEQIDQLIFSIMNDKQLAHFKEQLDIDFSYAVPELGRFRVNVFKQQRGNAAVFRTVPDAIPTFEQINAPEIFKKIVNYNNGLILVTGATGSGKSTTLAAMIDHINQHKNLHILTIEDPIEFRHHPKKSLINQRELYQDTHSFNRSLKSVLREDPDVIMIGELRDQESIRLALTAAETGHLVFATLHTNSATKTIDRLIGAFSGNEQAMIRSMLSESLRAVISQQLIKKIPQGRIAAYEIMLATSAIKSLIREGKVAQMQSVIQTGAVHGMQCMEQDLKRLMAEQLIAAFHLS